MFAKTSGLRLSVTEQITLIWIYSAASSLLYLSAARTDIDTSSDRLAGGSGAMGALVVGDAIVSEQGNTFQPGGSEDEKRARKKQKNREASKRTRENKKKALEDARAQRPSVDGKIKELKAQEKSLLSKLLEQQNDLDLKQRYLEALRTRIFQEGEEGAKAWDEVEKEMERRRSRS